MCLQLVCASKTSFAGASKTRVTTTSVSVGVVNVVACLFVARIFPPLLRIELCKVEVESLVALVPELPEVAGPFGHFLEGCRLEPAWAPLCITSSRDQPGALEHTKVLRDRGPAHVERLGQFAHGGLAGREPGQDGAARGVG